MKPRDNPASVSPSAEPMRIGLVYDLRDDYLALGWDAEAVAEFDRADTIDALEGALRRLGHDVDRVGRAGALVDRLSRGDRWDLVFNIAEGVAGVGREALVPALLDHYGIACTFADPLVCAVTLDKPTAKRVLRDMGLPTPDFAVVTSSADAAGVTLRPPIFVKPAREGSSKGVSDESLVRDIAALPGVCSRMIGMFDQPALVEEFLPGREVTVGVVGTGASALAIAALNVGFREPTPGAVYGYDVKERCEELIDYTLDDTAAGRAAMELAERAYRALNCRDAGRVDLRQDARGEWSIIELNPLPGLHPEHSDLPILATLAGWSFDRLIGTIVASAAARIDGATVPARI